MCTHCLAFHTVEDDIEHLCQGGFGSGLVNEITAGKVDVIASSNCQQYGSLMDLTC